MKSNRLEQMKQQMIKKLEPDQADRVIADMEKEYLLLCQADAEKAPDFIRHLHNNIYPVVSTFRSLIKEGFSREEASELAQSTFLELMEDSAESIRKLCRIPGFHRIVPWLFGKLMPVLFKKSAGFDFKFLPTSSGHIRFDIITCPYYQACQELECPELAPVFCATDDICYGHMHPNLFWNRTKTIARGGDLCDFNLQVKQTK